jgi:hypothetical protein
MRLVIDENAELQQIANNEYTNLEKYKSFP